MDRLSVPSGDLAEWVADLQRRLLAEPVAISTEGATRAVVVADSADRAAALAEALAGSELTYVAKGRWLYVVHPWVRWLLLGLLGLADEDDGVASAQATTFPFFETSMIDRATYVARKRSAPADLRQRWEEIGEAIQRLRALAHSTSPGAAALLLAERTSFRHLAPFHGSNRRVERALFWQVVAAVEREAWQRGVDLVGFAPVLRAWLAQPRQLGARVGRIGGGLSDLLIERLSDLLIE